MERYELILKAVTNQIIDRVVASSASGVAVCGLNPNRGQISDSKIGIYTGSLLVVQH